MVVLVQNGLSVLIVSPRDLVADCELWLPLPSITREYHTAYRWPGKGSKSKTRSTVSLLHHHQLKKS